MTEPGKKPPPCECDDTMAKYEHCPNCFAHIGPEGEVQECPACGEQG